jgi:hypothetical protein
MASDFERQRRLKLAWLREVITAAEQLARELQPAGGSPLDRLAATLSGEVDRWMTRRGVTHRTLGVRRRTLARALRGETVTTASIADLADALNCEVSIIFRARDGANGDRDDTTGSASTPAAAILSGETPARD